MTPIGNIEVEFVFRIAVRGRATDLAQMAKSLSEAEAVVIYVVETHAPPETQGQKNMTTAVGGLSE